MFYYNAQQRSTYSYAIPGVNYGIAHFSEDGNRPAEGMNIFNHDKLTGTFKSDRERFISSGSFGFSPDTNFFFETFSPASESQLILFQCIFNELKNRNFKKRTAVLLNILGFRDSGIHIDEDYLFIYDFFSFPRKFEIYLNSQTGTVTEINSYSFADKTECKYPVNSEGVICMFEELVQDLCSVYLPNGLTLTDEQHTKAEILGFDYVYEIWPYAGASSGIASAVTATVPGAAQEPPSPEKNVSNDTPSGKDESVSSAKDAHSLNDADETFERTDNVETDDFNQADMTDKSVPDRSDEFSDGDDGYSVEKTDSATQQNDQHFNSGTDYGGRDYYAGNQYRHKSHDNPGGLDYYREKDRQMDGFIGIIWYLSGIICFLLGFFLFKMFLIVVGIVLTYVGKNHWDKKNK